MIRRPPRSTLFPYTPLSRPPRGEETQHRVEDEHRHEAEPEDRHRAEEHRAGRDQPVEPPARAHGGGDTERDADDRTDRDGGQRELERRWPELPDVLDHRPAVDHRAAEVALER